MMAPRLEPQIAHDDPSALCSLGPRPQLISGFLIQHLQQHFAQADTIEQDNLRQYLWRYQPSNVDNMSQEQLQAARNNILIESAFRWDANNTGRRPAILVRRNDWEYIKLGIGDFMQAPWHGDGWERYSHAMGGSHTIFCMAPEAAECETLAYEVVSELTAFGQKIRAWLQLLRFQVMQLGRPQVVVESRQHFGIPITVAYAHNQNWTIRKQVPVLGSIALDLRDFAP